MGVRFRPPVFSLPQYAAASVRFISQPTPSSSSSSSNKGGPPRTPQPAPSKAKASSTPDDDVEYEVEFEDAAERVTSVTGERGGPRGPEPTRHGDWHSRGRVSDF